MRLLLGGNILYVRHSLYTQLNFGSTMKCFSEYSFFFTQLSVFMAYWTEIREIRKIRNLELELEST